MRLKYDGLWDTMNSDNAPVVWESLLQTGLPEIPLDLLKHLDLNSITNGKDTDFSKSQGGKQWEKDYA